MKKTIIIIMLFIAAFTASAQTPTPDYRVKTRDEQFRRNMPVGTKLFCLSDSTYWAAIGSLHKDSTINTSLDSLFQINSIGVETDQKALDSINNNLRPDINQNIADIIALNDSIQAHRVDINYLFANIGGTQTLSIDSTGRVFTISISGGNSVKFEDTNTDNQDLQSVTDNGNTTTNGATFGGDLNVNSNIYLTGTAFLNNGYGLFLSGAASYLTGILSDANGNLQLRAGSTTAKVNVLTNGNVEFYNNGYFNGDLNITGQYQINGSQLTTTNIPEGTNLYYTDTRVSANSDVSANTAKVSFPGFTSLLADYGFNDNSTKWDTAYGWGNWATGVPSATMTFTNKSGNISQWTNDSGYLNSLSAGTMVDVSGNTINVDLSEATNSSTGLTSSDYLVWLDGGVTQRKTTISNILALGGSGASSSGASGAVQFSDGSGGFSSSTNFSWNDATNTLTISNSSPSGYAINLAGNLNVSGSFNYFSGGSAIYTFPLLQGNEGTAGYSLTSNGSGSAPTWQAKLTGSGTSGRVAYWNGSRSLTSDADFTFDGLNLRVGLTDGTGLVYSGNFVGTSDRRLKRNIHNLKDLSWVDKIRFKSFSVKADITNRERYGIIAQQLLKLNKGNLVYTDETGHYSVAYIDFLIAKAARQDQKIKALEERLNEIENRLKALENEK